jgi:hypothetical protein
VEIAAHRAQVFPQDDLHAGQMGVKGRKMAAQEGIDRIGSKSEPE